LAVGDQTFQAKCIDRIMEMKRAGVTILFISHDLSNVADLCSDVIWLDRGIVRLIGPTDHVLAHYQDHLFQRVGEQLTYEDGLRGFRRWGTREIEIDGVRLLNDEDEESAIFCTGDSLTVELDYHAHKPVDNPEFGLAIHRHDGVHVTGPNNRTGGLMLGVVEGRGTIRYIIDCLPLLPGRYQLTVAAHDSIHPIAYDYHEEAYSFRVIEGGTAETEGILTLEASWEWYKLPVDTIAETAYPPGVPV
jgi:hypothetical protein